MSSLTKFTPTSSTNHQPQSRPSYFSTKTSTIVIILFSIFFFLISHIQLPSFTPSHNINQHDINDIYSDSANPIHIPGQNPESEHDIDITFDPGRDLDIDIDKATDMDMTIDKSHPCPYSSPRTKHEKEKRGKKGWGFFSPSASASASGAASPSASPSPSFAAASSTGEFWVSDLGPIERVHVKLGSA